MKLKELKNFFSLLEGCGINVDLKVPAEEINLEIVVRIFRLDFGKVKTIFQTRLPERQKSHKVYHIRKEDLYKVLQNFFENNLKKITEINKVIDPNEAWEINLKPFGNFNFNHEVDNFIESLKKVSFESKYIKDKKQFKEKIELKDIPDNYIEEAKTILKNYEENLIIARINLAKACLINQSEQEIREKIVKYVAEEIVCDLQAGYQNKNFRDELKFWIYLENIVVESILYGLDDKTIMYLYKNRFASGLSYAPNYERCMAQLQFSHDLHIDTLKNSLQGKECTRAVKNFENSWKELQDWFQEKLEHPVSQESFQVSKPALAVTLAFLASTMLWLTGRISTESYIYSLMFFGSVNVMVPASRVSRLINFEDYRTVQFTDEECGTIGKVCDQLGNACLALIETKDGQKIIFSNDYVREKHSHEETNASHPQFLSLKELTQTGKIVKGGSKKSKSEEKEMENKAKDQEVQKSPLNRPPQNSSPYYFFTNNDNGGKPAFRKINLAASDLSDLLLVERDKVIKKLQHWEADIRKTEGKANYKIRIPGENGRVVLKEGIQEKNGEIEYIGRGYHKGHKG